MQCEEPKNVRGTILDSVKRVVEMAQWIRIVVSLQRI